jgi:hypothetical protein
MKDVKHLAAELALLRLYNGQRTRLGHDFGNGARWAELSRRQRELESSTAHENPSAYELERDVTRNELLAAYQRVGKVRHRRAVRNAERYGTTSARKTRQAWGYVATWIGATSL